MSQIETDVEDRTPTREPTPELPTGARTVYMEDCLAVVLRCQRKICNATSERVVTPAELRRGLDGMPLECADCGEDLLARDVIAFILPPDPCVFEIEP